ncbi:uncharacterized protein B0I36DRAFT_317856 [Microdochium trichocladiopsis]|uniref:NADH-ubiquinone oxidoreductase 17.8 kDa subunit n=1 Tax=Microdochium trichocladiopsis TaxID=1682393 RepID=A0A9P8YDT6_9PEZI|nr:uncharacterized protein B0I36DRAFT_317856 [Microdochium trichocladiopsis]KAH7035208.1 hypothetical protein B0I36DRAFT_317856 [Microdochium trichocladiopsis]
MQAFRTRAACAARQTATRASPLRSRSFASDHGHGHAAPEVAEGLGTAFYVFVGAIPLSILGYQITRPGKDGEPSSMTKWLQGFDAFNETERRNTIRTNIVEEAAHDKHLFYYGQRNQHVELKMPELFNTGSPYARPAGHRAANLEAVTEHYRKQYEEEEERKIQKLAALKKNESS